MKKFSFCSLILLCSTVAGTLLYSNPVVYELDPDQERCSEVEFSTIPVEERISTRTFPSIFQPASPMWVEGVSYWDRVNTPELVPYHDLLLAGYIHYGGGGHLRLEKNTLGSDIILEQDEPQKRHAYYHARNPNFVSLFWWDFFASVPGDIFPDEPKYWLTDREGNRIPYSGGRNLYHNFLDPEVQEILIKQGVGIASCGIFDGTMADNFGGGPGRIVAIDNREERLGVSEAEMEAAIIHIFSEIRARVPDDFIILVNAGVSEMESLSELINGSAMEFVREPHRHYNYDDLLLVENALVWNETNLRHPSVNALLPTGLDTEHPNSPNNQKWMRVFTTLALTFSDGYINYHMERGPYRGHYPYDFWDADLGRPIGAKGEIYENIDGLFIREFTNGWAVYNRSGQEQQIQLPKSTTGVSSGIKGHSHTLPDLDGEIYLKNTGNVADLNGDGVVNILDLVIVVNAFGEAEPDLNGDRVVNIQDLVIVANAF